MGRISTSQFYRQGVNDLLTRQTELGEAQNKLSTGKKLLTAKDDPIGAARVVILQQEIAQTRQYQSQIESTRSHLNGSEANINTFIERLHGLRTMALSANNGARTQQELRTIKLQMQQVLGDLVTVANTKINNSYIFAGAKTDTVPIHKEADGTYNYQGDEAIRSLQIGASAEMASNYSGQEIFFAIASKAINVSGSNNIAQTTATASALVASSSLNGVGSGTLKLNGIDIAAATTDGVSTSDVAASSIATASAINKLTSQHGVVAKVAANAVSLTGGTFTTNALAAGDLTINGVAITGSAATNDAAGFAALINSQNVPGIIASDSAGQVILTAADGRNIQLETDGATASGIDFANFSLNSGAQNQVARGAVTLVSHQAIDIKGSNPEQLGFTTGIINPSNNNTGTGVLAAPYIAEARDEASRDDDKYLIEFGANNTFNIYRNSQPMQAVTTIKHIPAGSDISHAKTLTGGSFSYTAGDSFVIDGIQFSISGTPNSGDSFMLNLEPAKTNNAFALVENLISTVTNYGDDGARLSYEIGISLEDLSAIEDRLIQVRSSMGQRQVTLDDQQKANDALLIFSNEAVSEVQDLDYAEAISTFMRKMLSLQAAQKSMVQMQRLSLLDLL